MKLLDEQDEFGFTALHHSFLNKDTLSFAILLKYGADVFEKYDAFGNSVSDLVVIRGNNNGNAWYKLHLTMCQLVFGIESNECRIHTNEGPIKRDTRECDHSNLSRNDSNWEIPDNYKYTLPWGSLSIAPPHPSQTQDIPRLDGTQSTIADIISSIAKGEPVLIENAMVSILL